MKETADQWAGRWEIWQLDGGNVCHLVPIGDAVAHEIGEDCVCGPTSKPTAREDGTIGWMICHPALDGRRP